MIRLLKELLPESINFAFLTGSIPTILLLIFSIIIARFVANRFSGPASTLITIGTAIKVISFFFYVYLQGVMMPKMRFNELTKYFVANNIFNFVGEFLFLLGIFKLFKVLHTSSKKEGFQI